MQKKGLTVSLLPESERQEVEDRASIAQWTNGVLKRCVAQLDQEQRIERDRDLMEKRRQASSC